MHLIKYPTKFSLLKGSFLMDPHFNSQKTHCLRGHAFDSENTYIHPSSGSRQCKKCRYLRQGKFFKDNPRYWADRSNKYYKENKETCRARMKGRYEEFKTKHFFRWRASSWTFGSITAEEIAGLWKRQRGKCALSGRRLDQTAQLDHILPRSMGGNNHISNLRWVDPLLNQVRGNILDPDFVSICRDVVNTLGEKTWN